MDRGAWQAIVHGATKSWTLTEHAHTFSSLIKLLSSGKKMRNSFLDHLNYFLQSFCPLPDFNCDMFRVLSFEQSGKLTAT